MPTFYSLFVFLLGLSLSQQGLAALLTLDADQKVREEFMLGEDIYIAATDLPPFAVVKLVAETGSGRSENFYRASLDGKLDLQTQAPIAGGYRSVDPEGPFWSMLPVGPNPQEAYSLDVRLSLFLEDKVLFEKNISRKLMAEPLAQEQFSLASNGFIGHLFLPAGKETSPALIVLGGGEGGISGSAFMAAHFASLGYASLAVAYFGLPGLPAGVDRVPLEFFEKALLTLQQHPRVQANKIGIMGGSRGGEGALIAASHIEGFAAVVSNMGSAFALSGYDMKKQMQIAPWTYRGQDLPFVSNLIFGQETFRTHPDGVQAFEFISTRDWSFLNDDEGFKNKRIPSENIQAPVLYLSSGDDRLWPSSQLLDFSYQQRQAKNDVWLFYPQSGHVLGGIPGMALPSTYFLFPGFQGMEIWEYGGLNAEVNAKDRRDSYKKILQFLKLHL